MNKRDYDVVIIGGGASGLAAAVELGMSSPELSVLVIEKMDEPGRKLRATGSGRCNITNTAAAGYDRIMEFFDRIGLATREHENGLVYPYSESAADVASLLAARAEQLGVDLCCGESVLSIKLLDETPDPAGRMGRFVIESSYKDGRGEQRVLTRAAHVLLSCGGKAGPTYGTTGDGYRIAKELGHSIVTPVPALTGVECAEWSLLAVPDAHMLAGTRTRADAMLYRGDTQIFRESGEVQFTRYGLSGICIFNMSRHMRYSKAEGESIGDYTIKLDLYPGLSFADRAESIRSGDFPDLRARDMLSSVLKEPLVEYISIKSEGDIERTIDMVHGLVFHPTWLRGWKDAQVTSGGISTDEIDEASSMSKLIPGLYITGEIADRDYPCGGYNLSNAWLTGLAAADDIAKR